MSLFSLVSFGSDPEATEKLQGIIKETLEDNRKLYEDNKKLAEKHINMLLEQNKNNMMLYERMLKYTADVGRAAIKDKEEAPSSSELLKKIAELSKKVEDLMKKDDKSDSEEVE